MSKAILTTILCLFGLGSTVSAADCTILAKNCDGKTRYVIDRDPGEGTGTECGCPCNSATWMGIKGIYYTPKDGEIWYSFPCETAKYTVTINYMGDGDGYAKFKIYVAGQKIGEGTIGHSSGQQTFGPVCINKGDEIKVWLRSDYSTGAKDGKHGNYGRFDKLLFNKTGSCGGSPPPAPGNPSNLKASSVGESSATLNWDAGSNAEQYVISWTGGGSATTPNTSYTITGLTAETDYTATVKSKNSTGTSSGVSTTFTTTPPRPAQYATVPFRVNVGGSAQGEFLADKQWQEKAAYGYDGTGSTTATGTGEVSGTTDDAVFQSVRYKTFDYKIRVANGDYDVSLLFAEFWRDNAGGRTFTASINGGAVSPNPIDIYSEVGKNAALVITENVSVSNELITVDFTPTVSDPMISGIIVAEASGTTPQVSPTITSPKEGETYAAGETMNITWTSSEPLNVKLVVDVSLDGGKVWTQIVDQALAEGTQKYDWTIPAELSVYDASAGKPVPVSSATENAIIMVYDYDNHDTKGLSGTFTITSSNAVANGPVAGYQDAARLHRRRSLSPAPGAVKVYDLRGRRVVVPAGRNGGEYTQPSVRIVEEFTPATR